MADPQGNKLEGSPPDRKKPRHSPNADNTAPQAGPSGTASGPSANTTGTGTPQQPPQVPVGGLAPGMRHSPGAGGFTYNVGQPMATGMMPHHLTQQVRL